MSKHISFFIARYSYSGVPLAQLRLAKAFARRGFEVDFVIGYVDSEFKLPDGLNFEVLNLGQPRTYKLLPRIMAFLRSTQPDIIFSAEDHLNAIVTTAAILTGSRAKISASSRVTPYDTYSNTVFSKRWVLKRLNQLLWKRSDTLTCVSKDMVLQYQAIFGQTKHQAVYNVIVDTDLERKASEEVDHPWLIDNDIPVVISAGRLAPEKGFPDLIAAMKLVNEQMSVRLVILGEGPLRSELQQMIEEKGLGQHVQLLGYQPNPYKFYAKSRLFVLSSYVEGLPNVLVEAMACGCNIVSTDCPTGPREVLMDGQFGELVPVRSPQAMADAIIRSLNVPRDLEKSKKAVFPFTEEQVFNTYQRILEIN
ncbi:glycosyltransferase [Methylovulum psychrotolerans]|jgi:glycosyltransferase involved in cell wall biosynthesis|uniref:glycosyltransferase n=1 Tax=Methylovulum psychrotolerans TaxID=1704499 RepID=UPI001BFFB127|nr:glycosyltransferase [Methylovulum psychrotolerans]MBT9099547.1 glycosyltransferase [Methylovulum psychrotolerans]